ncbi:MAG: GNAT family N-acetyltransferase, partial [Anaerolineae bacterium]|nr:GNAT family N-acetyltransferase [Anaerolineae bacterium]
MAIPELRNIRWPEEREAIMEHIRLVHGPGDSDLLRRWYGGFPGFDPADCFVIDAEDGGLAAHTMLIPRQFQIGVSTIPASEIGVVGTLETHRGRGYARALLTRALERMSARGDALGMILGIPNFYERWGYEYAVGLYLTSYESEIATEHALQAGKWDMVHSYNRRMAAYLGMRGREVRVRPFGMSDLPAVRMLYEQESIKGHYLVARNNATWEWQLDFLADVGRYEPDDFLVAEIDNQVVAYARVISHGQVNWFMEAEAARFSLVECAGDDAD